MPVLSLSASGTVFPPAFLLLVEFLERLLQDADELVQVVFRTAPQQADHGLDPVVLVVTENFGDPTLNRRLEREEDPTTRAARSRVKSSSRAWGTT